MYFGVWCQNRNSGWMVIGLGLMPFKASCIACWFQNTFNFHFANLIQIRKCRKFRLKAVKSHHQNIVKNFDQNNLTSVMGWFQYFSENFTYNWETKGQENSFFEKFSTIDCVLYSGLFLAPAAHSQFLPGLLTLLIRKGCSLFM